LARKRFKSTPEGRTITGVSQREAHFNGHPTALLHELEFAMKIAEEEADDDPEVPDPQGERYVPPDYPVTVPYWVCEVLRRRLLPRLEKFPRGRTMAVGARGLAADLIHWHR